MKKKIAGRLRLHRETLHNLNERSLRPAVGGVISDASNCQHCQTVQPCLETGTCWEPTIDGCWQDPTTTNPPQTFNC